VSLSCENACTLIPSYLDGEVSEEQAGPLRQHLMACPACREVTKSETALGRWIVAGPPVAAPAGFASRIARAAFSGRAEPELPPQPEPSQPAERDGALYSFVLAATATAAAALFALSIGLQRASLPSESGLDAAPELDTLLREIELENRQLEEGGAATDSWGRGQ